MIKIANYHAPDRRVWCGKVGGSVARNQYGQPYNLSGGGDINVAMPAEKADQIMLDPLGPPDFLPPPSYSDPSYGIWKELQDYDDYVKRVGDTRYSAYFRKQFPELRKFYYLDDNDSAYSLLRGEYEKARKREINEPYEQIITTKTVVIPSTFATPEKFEIIKESKGVTIPIIANESEKEINGVDKIIPIRESLN